MRPPRAIFVVDLRHGNTALQRETALREHAASEART
jgi:hypothetical protein